jgi:hypothetical protein
VAVPPTVWEVDSNWNLTELRLFIPTQATESEGITADLFMNIDTGLATSVCSDLTAGERCGGFQESAGISEVTFISDEHSVSEPHSIFVFSFGLATLLVLIWTRRRA